MIAALFVLPDGPYVGLEDVDPWPESRDARLYAGPWPVVAHPPCQRWGRYWHGGPSAKKRMIKGDDGGCFAAALGAVRQWGGVLEHPAYSSAWDTFGLTRPPRAGWIMADTVGGWTCRVEQGHYGHRARKASWLYAVRTDRPRLAWGPSATKAPIDFGFHTAEERRQFMRPPAGMSPEMREKRRRWLARYAQATGKELVVAERMSKRESSLTPIPFRDLLLSLARSVPTPHSAHVGRQS